MDFLTVDDLRHRHNFPNLIEQGETEISNAMISFLTEYLRID